MNSRRAIVFTLTKRRLRLPFWNSCGVCCTPRGRAPNNARYLSDQTDCCQLGPQLPSFRMTGRKSATSIQAALEIQGLTAKILMRSNSTRLRIAQMVKTYDAQVLD
jgi:hypothetical protein